MSTCRAENRRSAPSFLAAIALAIAGPSVCANPALAGECTRRHPNYPLLLELSDLRVESTLRADAEADGTPDLFLLASQPPRRLAAVRVVVRAGAPLAAEFLSEGLTTSERVVYRALHDGDFDGDGRLDLLTVFQFGSWSGPVRIELFFGLGDGRFEPGLSTVRTDLRDALTYTGDFDGDGRTELAFPRLQSLRVFRHDRSADWSEVYERTLPFRFGDAVVADFDRDGDDDFAVWSPDYSTALVAVLGSPWVPLVDWWLTWVGSFEGPRVALDRRGTEPPTLLAGIGSLQWNPQLIGLRWDTTSLSFVPLWITPRPPEAVFWTPLELDGDGREDVVLELAPEAGPYGPSHWPGQRGWGYQVLLSQLDGPPVLGERGRGLPRLIDARDLDGDGVLDGLLLADSSVGLVRYRGLPGTRFAEPDRFGEPLGGFSVEYFPASLDRDGTLDVLAYRRWYSGLDRNHFYSLLGRGDGRFDRLERTDLLDVPAFVAVRDVDGDGAVDFVVNPRDDPPGVYGTATNVYYGRGDGTFEPHVPLPHLAGGRMWSYIGWHFGDLDGDGDDDLLPRIPPWGRTDVMAWPLFMNGREGRYGPRGLERRGDSGYVSGLLDVDGDGRDDPFYFLTPSPRDPARTALVWRRITEAGEFEAEQVLLDWDPSAWSLVAAMRGELDSAEAGEELLFQLQGSEGVLTMTLSGSAATGNRLLWSGETAGPSAGVLADADSDGTLDLVTYSGGLHVVPGDGRGGFPPRRLPTWYAERTAMLGDFTGDARLELLANFFLGTEYLSTLTVDAGRVLETDLEPPKVEIRLEPVIDRLTPPVGFENTWRATTLVEDECDAAPEIQSRQVNWVPVLADTAIRFRRAAETELRLYERPGSASLTLVLLGPVESEVRSLFERLQQQGGAAIDRVAILGLVATDAYGTRAADLGDGDLAGRRDRLVRRFTFRDGWLTAAAVTQPGGDLTLTARARDAAGRETQTSASLVQTRRDLCATGEIPGCE